MSQQEITVATVNIAGARRANDSNPDKYKRLAEVLTKYDPDIIGLQEVIQVPGAGRDDLRNIQTELGGEWVSFFFPHLDSQVHSHPKKWTSEIFKDYFLAGERIMQGAGILVKKEPAGAPGPDSLNSPPSAQITEQAPPIGVIIPYPDTVYGGDRDTEPRSLLITRLQINGKNLFFGCTHLSAFSEEDHPLPGIRKPTPRAIAKREKQTQWIVAYIKSLFQELGSEGPLILTGDFNCEPDAVELRPLQRLGLIHAHLGAPQQWTEPFGWTETPNPPHTHRKKYHPVQQRRILVDHIFVSAKDFTVQNAFIIDLEKMESMTHPGIISDHNPVIVTLTMAQ